MTRTFRVGITRDFLKPDGTPGFDDVRFEQLNECADIDWEFLPELTPELTSEQVRDYDGLLVLASQVSERTVQNNDRLMIVARFGVGYDKVDVDALTRRSIPLTITPDGVRRPVATVAMTFLLAVSHKLVIKDRLTRAGRWADRMDHMGTGLTGRTLGVIGFGNIGREVFRLAKPFDLKCIAHDPFFDESAGKELGVEPVDLETLLKTADFVMICCALTPETHGLINAQRLSLMKPTAFLINVARGPIVDQQALTIVLQEGRIQGAGLDVFAEEPIDPQDLLLKLENVVVTPHALSFTDEGARGLADSSCRSILDIAAGRVPQYVVNREVLDHPRFQEKLAARAEQAEAP